VLRNLRNSGSALSAIAAALVVAFVLAPAPLAGLAGVDYAGERQVSAAAGQGFVEYWRSGDRDLSPGMQQVVGYWFRYHVAKAVIAALLLAVLIPLGVRVWTAFVRASRRRALLAAGGVLVTVLGLFAVVVVMANVRGSVAPFSSLMSMLPGSPATGGLGETLDQVRQGLGAGDDGRPALAVMVSDFARYHVVLAVTGALVTILALVLGVLAWTRRAAGRSARRVVRSYGVVAVAFSLIMALVVAANISTAADPAPALLAAFQGGF
jgi:hypothetical protein